LSGAPQSPATGRRGSDVAIRGDRRRQNVITTPGDTQGQCSEMRSQYLRSQCRDNGFLTVQRNRALVQTTGLNTTHVEAEFAVEVCSGLSRASSSVSLTKAMREPVIRYRHKKSNKYLCFSRSGRVRVWTKRKADRRGALCMFRQVPVDTGRTYHRLQSVHNRRWHLGFNHKASSLAVIQGRAPHKGALPRHGKFFDPKRCDFNFYAGEHRRQMREFEFSGLESLIESSRAKKQQQPHITKAAISSDNEIGPRKPNQTELVTTTMTLQLPVIERSQKLTNKRSYSNEH